MRTEVWPIDKITTDPGRRPVVASHVQKLSISIAAVGMIQRPVIREDGRLLVGAHRLEAARLIGWTEIECEVMSVDEIDAELIQIDENLLHRPLSRAETMKALARRKELYEARHPETKRGGDRKSEAFKNQMPSTGHLILPQVSSFTTTATSELKRGRGSIDRDVRIGAEFSLDEIEHMEAAKIPLLAQDKLVALRHSEPESVNVIFALPAGRARQAAQEIVDFDTPKRDLRHAAEVTSGRKGARQREADMAKETAKNPPPMRNTTPACHTEKYSCLGSREREEGQNRTVTLDINPVEAAKKIAHHFDKNEMKSFLYRLRPYLTPDTIRYVLENYGEQGASSHGNSGLVQLPLV